jgi:L-fuculose-phosphate aldolase
MTATATPIRSTKGQQKWDIKSPHFQIAAARRMLYRNDLCSQVGGHVSLRVSGEKAFWVTPFQYFDETLPEHVMKVSFDLEVLEPGTLPASPGINFHASVMEARPDVNCVIHLHSETISKFASARVPFDVYYVYGALFIDSVGEFVDDPSLTPDEEGTAIAKAVGPRKVGLMPHHGSVHTGASLELTVAETIVFSQACEHQLAAMQTGAKPMDRKSALSYKAAYERFGFREQIWQANFRRLWKSDPDLIATLG